MSHYVQVTDSHFEKAVQNPVQQASEMHRFVYRVGARKPRKTLFSGVPNSGGGI